MADSEVFWAGFPFLPLGLHDGRFLRAPGVYAFVHRAGPDRLMLLAGEAEDVARIAGPAHPRWAEALTFGANEVCVYLAPGSRVERLMIVDRLVRRYLPALNPETGAVLAGEAAPALAHRAGEWKSSRS